MAEKVDPKHTGPLKNLRWEMAALVKVLERNGILSEEEVLDMIQELRRKTPKAQSSQESLS
jgi:hypothetical protein